MLTNSNWYSTVTGFRNEQTTALSVAQLSPLHTLWHSGTSQMYRILNLVVQSFQLNSSLLAKDTLHNPWYKIWE